MARRRRARGARRPAVVALVPLPAFLSVLGAADRTRSRRSGCSGPPPAAAGRGSRAWVMRRPGRVALVAASVLDRARAPGARASTSSASTRTTLPTSASSRQVAEALARRATSAGATSPITAIARRAAASGRDRRARGGTRRAAAVPAARGRWPGLWRLDILPRDEGLADAPSSSSARCARSCPTPASPGRPPPSSTSRRRSRRTCRGRSRSSRSRPARSSSCSPARSCCR